ncbi:MAG: exodeoxyribonuclease VII small subunit [Quisquiliibacterium sp.]
MTKKAPSPASANPGEQPNLSPPQGIESFEQAIAELESLVDQMETGSLSLEQSMLAYRRGAQLVNYCRQTLAQVQQQVRVLEGDLLRTFDPDTDQQEPGP